MDECMWKINIKYIHGWCIIQVTVDLCARPSSHLLIKKVGR